MRQHMLYFPLFWDVWGIQNRDFPKIRKEGRKKGWSTKLFGLSHRLAFRSHEIERIRIMWNVKISGEINQRIYCATPEHYLLFGCDCVYRPNFLEPSNQMIWNAWFSIAFPSCLTAKLWRAHAPSSKSTWQWETPLFVGTAFEHTHTHIYIYTYIHTYIHIPIHILCKYHVRIRRNM